MLVGDTKIYLHELKLLRSCYCPLTKIGQNESMFGKIKDLYDYTYQIFSSFPRTDKKMITLKTSTIQKNIVKSRFVMNINKKQVKEYA